MGRRALTGLVAFAMVIWSLPLMAAPAAAASSTIVISQIYGGGGNTGATFKNDFIELYNLGTSNVNVSGWSVQYAATTGSTWQVTPLSGWIRPGRYYLIQEAAGAGGTTSLPTPHAVGGIPMAAGAGKVALSSTTTGLSGTCPTGLVDFVGYGTGTNCFEGTGPTAPSLTNTTAAFRKNNGATDTDNNAADFSNAAPNPRATADYQISVVATTPAGANVPLSTNIGITFSEPANVTGVWFTISCTLSGAHTATVTGGPTTFTLDPDTDFMATETCSVTVLASNVSDQDTDDPPDSLAANFVFSFQTLTPPLLIHDIQGAAHLSPKTGATVAGVNGIVTGKQGNGFYMEAAPADWDADDSTSEGIFVFTNSAPASVAVGDAVTVSGKVQEFRPGSGGLTTTEIGGGPTVVVNSHGNPLPPAISIGVGRMPPTEVIEDDSTTGNVETNDTFDPANDGIDFWESLEGMRVDLGTVAVVGPSNTFGEISVLANNGAGATGRTARGGIKIGATDKNPERVIIKGVGFPMPSNLNVGDQLAGPIVGVVDYNFGNFMIQVFTAPTRVDGGLAKEITAASAAHELAVATFNVQNLNPLDPQSKFDTLASLIVNNLRAPDLISVQEVQDNSGYPQAGGLDDGTVDASVTLGKLRDAVIAAGGPTYQWREIDPVNDQDGGAPGGNIRQVFFFRTDRGLAFIDRPGGDSTTADAVVNVGGQAQLAFSPGRIDPGNSAWSSSRKPLAGEFTYNGHHVIAIANHWNSKGGDDALWGIDQPPVLSSEAQRDQQAQIVRDFVASMLSIDPNTEVAVLGDLNDFEFSNPLAIVKTAPLNDLIETLPVNERYSYVFEGNSQTLDHILVSNSLVSHAIYDVVHVNAEFWDQVSDHDPEVARITLLDTTPPTITAPADFVTFTGPGSTANVVFISDADLGTATAADDAGPVTVTRTGVPSGNLFPIGTTIVTYTATDGSGNIAVATQMVAVVDDTPPTVVAPAAVTRPATGLTTFVSDAVLGSATAADNSGTVTVVRSGVPSGNLFPVGTTTITYTATDGAGNTASATQTVTIAPTTVSVCALLRTLVTNVGEQTSLCAKLSAAADASARGNVKAHDNQLQAFINEVNAQRGKAIADADADRLIALAGTL